MRKGVYASEYTDDVSLPDVSLPEKEDFYSHLRMENITDAAYGHAKSLQRI